MSTSLKDWGIFDTIPPLFEPEKISLDLNKMLQPNYMDDKTTLTSNRKTARNFFITFAGSILRSIKKKEPYSIINSTSKLNFLSKKLFLFFEELYTSLKREEMILRAKNLKKTIKNDKKYIYFALHKQPEAAIQGATLPTFMQEQILAIEQLSNWVPKNYKIVVKDHPHQFEPAGRNNLFYERMLRLKNVEFVNSSYSSFELIDKSVLVSTLIGTVGWEARLRKKPVIIFGEIWYKTFPGIFKFSNNLNIENVLASDTSIDVLSDHFYKVSSKFGFGLCDHFYVDARDFLNHYKSTFPELVSKEKRFSIRKSTGWAEKHQEIVEENNEKVFKSIEKVIFSKETKW